MLMQKDTNKNRSVSSEVTKTLINALQSINDADLKKDVELIKIENAAEVSTGENKKCYLVHVSEDSVKPLHKVHAEVVKKLETKFSNPIVLVPTRKKINGNLFRTYRGKKVPRKQTLTSVYDAWLEDVLYPAVIVGKRVRFPKGKTRLFKVFVDSQDRGSVEHKLNAVVASYKALTNRDLQVEFQ